MTRGLSNAEGPRGRTPRPSRKSPRRNAWCWVSACSRGNAVHRTMERVVVDSISRLGTIGDCRNDCESFRCKIRNAMNADIRPGAPWQRKGSKSLSIISPVGSGYSNSGGCSLSLVASCRERVFECRL